MDIKLFALFAGRSGSGKTTAAASMPKPLEEIDCDLRANGLVSLLNQGWLSPTDIDITQVDPFGGYIELEKHLNNLYNLAVTKQLKYKSIDIGSATSLIRLLNLSSVSKNSGVGHLQLAGLAMTGPADYKFESQAAHKIFDFLRVLPCHVTVAAHIIDRYGKAPNSKETDPQVVIGEKLTLGTANLAENILAIFNDVYRFEKRIINNEEHYFVNFSTDMAKNSFGIPPGEFDITRKNFYEFFCGLVGSIKEGTFKKPEPPKGGLIL